MSRALDTFLALLTISTVPAAVGFPIWYHLRMRWRSSEMGRHVMAYSSVVALAYLSALIGMVFHNWLFEIITRLVISLGMSIVVWWRVIVFIRIRRRVMIERRYAEEPVVLDRKVDQGMDEVSTS